MAQKNKSTSTKNTKKTATRKTTKTVKKPAASSKASKPSVSRKIGGLRNPPLGVKIISVLQYIGAALSLIVGLTILVWGVTPFYFGTVLTGFGIVLIFIIAVVDFFIARGLWMGSAWARIIVIVFAVIGIVGGIADIFAGSFGSVVGLIVSAAIAWYLISDSGVREFFGK